MLAKWEWACCGDPFTVGDDIDFGIQTRTPVADLADLLGGTIAGTVDAVESHHEEEFADRVRGRVTAIHAVTHEVIERRRARRPGHGAPLDAVMPAEGEDWPMAVRDLGGGVSIGSRPSRYMIEVAPVPDSALLTTARGVGLTSGQPDDLATLVVDDPPAERRTTSLVGWLVDVDDY